MAFKRKTWKPEVETMQEDDALAALVNEHGSKNWAEIAQLLHRHYSFPPRIAKQCRDRWYNHLSPSVKAEAWSPAEQAVLFEAHRVRGNRWSAIAQLLPGRTESCVKNHFYSAVRRHLRRYNRTRSTSQQLKGPLKDLLDHSEFAAFFLNAICIKTPVDGERRTSARLENRRRSQRVVDPADQEASSLLLLSPAGSPAFSLTPIGSESEVDLSSEIVGSLLPPGSNAGVDAVSLQDLFDPPTYRE